MTNWRPRSRAESKRISRTFVVPHWIVSLMLTRWLRCMLSVWRMVVPLRVTVAKVSRPEKIRSVNLGVVVLVGFGGRGRSRW